MTFGGGRHRLSARALGDGLRILPYQHRQAQKCQDAAHANHCRYPLHKASFGFPYPDTLEQSGFFLGPDFPPSGLSPAFRFPVFVDQFNQAGA